MSLSVLRSSGGAFKSTIERQCVCVCIPQAVSHPRALLEDILLKWHFSFFLFPFRMCRVRPKCLSCVSVVKCWGVIDWVLRGSAGFLRGAEGSFFVSFVP